MAKRIRISDVAALAGVSVTTVSHVLNEVPGKRVSPATRDRVRVAAGTLGYQANSLARGLRLQRSQTIALVSDQIATTPFAGGIIVGAQEAASKQGWLVILVNTGLDPELEEREIQALLQRQVDGFLYASMYHREIFLPAALTQVPTVLLDAQSKGSTSSVVPDEQAGGHAAVRELIAHGHTRIGYVNEDSAYLAARGRLAGYRSAMHEAGLEVDESLLLNAPAEAFGGYGAATRLLHRPDRPTALFCFNDRMAMGAYQAAAELGLRIPDDLSVVGFDNFELIAGALRPALTTVALPHHAMGTWAVDRLIAEIEGRADSGSAKAVLPCPLVRRGSVAPPPA